MKYKILVPGSSLYGWSVSCTKLDCEQFIFSPGEPTHEDRNRFYRDWSDRGWLIDPDVCPQHSGIVPVASSHIERCETPTSTETYKCHLCPKELKLYFPLVEPGVEGCLKRLDKIELAGWRVVFPNGDLLCPDCRKI